jgi:hypothetical protein
MPERNDATTANEFPANRKRAKRRSRFVHTAPGPEAPDVRDKAGAQRGMILMLIGGAVFWLAVAAVAIYLLR